MKAKDQLQADYQRLMAEVELLRADVAYLRSVQTAHICTPITPPGGMWPFYPLGGAAGPGIVYEIPLNTCVSPTIFGRVDTTGCAAAAPPIILNTAAACR